MREIEQVLVRKNRNYQETDRLWQTVA